MVIGHQDDKDKHIKEFQQLFVQTRVKITNPLFQK